MITERDTIKCEAVFNEDRTHRYLWKRVWNRDNPLATVIVNAINNCACKQSKKWYTKVQDKGVISRACTPV